MSITRPYGPTKGANSRARKRMRERICKKWRITLNDMAWFDHYYGTVVPQFFAERGRAKA